MSYMSELAIERHNRTLDALMIEVHDHETAIHCDRMAIYQATPASHHLTNALTELATLTPTGTELLTHQFIRLQLTLALEKLPKETIR